MHHGYMLHGNMHHGYIFHGDMHHGHICMGHTAWVPEGREGRSQAGPKGRKLEVGAQRAPKLLVTIIKSKLPTRPHLLGLALHEHVQEDFSRSRTWERNYFCYFRKEVQRSFCASALLWWWWWWWWLVMLIVMIYSVDDGENDGNSLKEKPSSGSWRLCFSARYQ